MSALALVDRPPVGLCFGHRELDDGLVVAVIPTIFNARLVIGDNYTVHRYWCYAGMFRVERAVAAMHLWVDAPGAGRRRAPDGDPVGWNKDGQAQVWRDGLPDLDGLLPKMRELFPANDLTSR